MSVSRGTMPVGTAGKDWYPGDAGLIARFSDGTVTDSNADSSAGPRVKER